MFNRIVGYFQQVGKKKAHITAFTFTPNTHQSIFYSIFHSLPIAYPKPSTSTLIISTHSTPPKDPPDSDPDPADSHSSAAVVHHNTPPAHTSAVVPKAEVLAAAEEEHNPAVHCIGLVLVIGAVARRSGGFVRIVFVWEEGRWVARDLVGGRSFVAQIGFGLVVGRLLVIVRSSESSGRIDFASAVLRQVDWGLVEGNCLGCSRSELGVVVCAFVRYIYRSAAIVIVAGADIEIRFEQRKPGDSIGQKTESVVEVKLELGIGLRNSWPGI